MSKGIDPGLLRRTSETAIWGKCCFPPRGTHCDAVGCSHMLHMKTRGIVVRHAGSRQWSWWRETNRVTCIWQTWNITRPCKHYFKLKLSVVLDHLGGSKVQKFSVTHKNENRWGAQWAQWMACWVTRDVKVKPWNRIAARNNPMHTWSNDLQQERWEFTMGKG